LNCAIARYQGCSEASKRRRLAAKNAACAGCSLDKAPAMALATAGMVDGEYHRCGLGVLSGSRRRFWTSMTVRAELGAAASILLMKLS
jgi:hypothetical protein